MVQALLFFVAPVATSASELVSKSDQSDRPDREVVVPWYTFDVPHDFSRIAHEALETDISMLAPTTQPSKASSLNRELAEYRMHFLKTFP